MCVCSFLCLCLSSSVVAILCLSQHPSRRPPCFPFDCLRVCLQLFLLFHLLCVSLFSTRSVISLSLFLSVSFYLIYHFVVFSSAILYPCVSLFISLSDFPLSLYFSLSRYLPPSLSLIFCVLYLVVLSPAVIPPYPKRTQAFISPSTLPLYSVGSKVHTRKLMYYIHAWKIKNVWENTLRRHQGGKKGIKEFFATTTYSF